MHAPATPNSREQPALTWHLFCRVIDNFGDIGVCWRLAVDLAAQGHAVRLYCDDARALAWMAPEGHPGVQVRPWPASTDTRARPTAADVVVEAFGCDPPPGHVAAVAAAAGRAPVWVNLEYLSAEAYVERSHGLPSPQHNGLTKWFFYPGYTERTGGLLREDHLAHRQAHFNRAHWLAQHGITLQPGERLASLFCYANPALPGLRPLLAGQPTLLLLTPGPAQAAAAASPASAGPLRTYCLPWLKQQAYDELLWACDLNFVRGEDSLVRAIWAGKPWVWQAYPQDDGAHHNKVQALLGRSQPGAAVAALWHWWNNMPGGPQHATLPNPPPNLPLTPSPKPAPPPPLPDLAPWQAQVQRWRQALLQQAPLATQLAAFVHSKRAAADSPPARI